MIFVSHLTNINSLFSKKKHIYSFCSIQISKSHEKINKLNRIICLPQATCDLIIIPLKKKVIYIWGKIPYCHYKMSHLSPMLIKQTLINKMKHKGYIVPTKTTFKDPPPNYTKPALLIGWNPKIGNSHVYLSTFQYTII